MPASIPSPIRAVLFDYGQVLSAPPDPAAWAEMQRICGVPEEVFAAAYWQHRHGYDRGTLTGRAYWLATGQHAGVALKDMQIDDLIAADTALWTQPNQPIIDWALRLQNAGTRTGILSNLGDDMTAGLLATLAWLAAFDFCLWSHRLLLAKPEPAIYAAAIAGMGVPAAGILFIDDRADNIEGALAAGMQAIQYSTHAAFEAEMNVRGLNRLWRTGQIG